MAQGVNTTESSSEGGAPYPAPTTLDEVELYDPDMYSLNGPPHAAFALLREREPVFFHPEPDGPGFWCFTKHADICHISRTPQIFSSAAGGTNIEDYDGEDLMQIQLLMLNMDPPQHVKFRKLIRSGLTMRMVRLMEPKIEAQVTEILDRIAPRGKCDFVREVAAELPLQVLAELLGVPMEDRGKLFDWSNRLIGFDDPEFQTCLEDARQAAMEVWFYANQLAEARKDQPMANDLVSILVNGEVDGQHLTEMEFDAFFLLLTVAGNETTRNALSGGLVALMEHPEQWERLQNNPDLIDSAVEEMLRWVSPVMYFRRTTLEETEIRGVTIPEGAKIVMFYHSGNRDEEVFENPQMFDIARTPNDHIAFGFGEHFCMGAALARLEMKVLVRQLIRRFPDIRINGDIRRLRSNFINGWKEIPVAYTPGG